MKDLNANEPEFTAKAIGEKEWGSPEATIRSEDQQAFESMEAFAAMLGEELKSGESKESLEPEQVETIAEHAKSGKRSKVVPFPGLYWISGIAAAFLLMLFVPFTTEFLKKSDDGNGELGILQEVELSIPSTRSDGKSHQKAVDLNSRIIPEKEDSLLENYVGVSDGDLVADKKTLMDNFPVMEKSSPYGASVSEQSVGKLNARNVKRETVAPAKMQMASRELSTNEEVYELSPFTLDVSAPPTAVRALSSGMGYGVGGTVSASGALQQEYSREGYASVEMVDFKSVINHPLSTFSIDVDTASYSNVRRMLESGNRPPSGAVRIEEFLNYFKYPSYSGPENEYPVGINIAAMPALWNEFHQLVRIGLKSGEIPVTERPNANLVFLVDVSGSMNRPNKLPLVQYSLNKLVEQMGEDDRIAVVVYAGNSGLALPSTTANNTETIQHAIRHLKAGGSTNGGAGIELAYHVASKHFIEGGINRVILCSDGDFNVGQSSDDALVRLIEEKRKSGVFFSILGFGSGNYQDAKMELLSNKGNGNFSYIDSEKEARKQLVGNLLGMLTCVAKDVKIQVEFNPRYVQAYRLLGYENRMLATEDFNDDRKDAGEMGAGHRVTALYEIVLVGAESPEMGEVDALKYQSPTHQTTELLSGNEGEWLNVKVRYKNPDAEQSEKFEVPFVYEDGGYSPEEKADLSFAVAVAGFTMKLRNESDVRELDWDDIRSILDASLMQYSDEDRLEFADLLDIAAELKVE